MLKNLTNNIRSHMPLIELEIYWYVADFLNKKNITFNDCYNLEDDIQDKDKLHFVKVLKYIYNECYKYEEAFAPTKILKDILSGTFIKKLVKNFIVQKMTTLL